ncbi:cadherin-like domain-containing protein [Methylobacterium sp. Leaf118]|uniref:cadherin-like domain-containing protein n=1 Tax=Methylobacterium sp. Leaf118 TaxID=2876562 RepID=UPI001E4115BB|nr:cadherin-like domain-containing protein [Methylobacterium sp. Leaf118]
MTILDALAAPEPGPSYGGLFSTRAYDATSGGTIRLDEGALLFKGEFARVGADLVISDAFHRVVVHDYFSVETRPRLEAPNGAFLSDAAIEALSLHPNGEPVAQAGTPEANAPIGRVQTLTGTATVTRNGTSVTLQVGDLVYKNDAIQTGRDSSLAVSFLDGTLFSLASEARMVLNGMVYTEGGTGNSALFDLVQGTISFVAGKVAKTGDMKVGTPVATMGIRGTAVHVQIEADGGDTRFSVMTEPDGTVGRFDLYDRTDPNRVLATVSDPNLATIIHPEGGRAVRVETVAKTLAELAEEAGLVQSLFKTIAEAPRLPVFQGPGNGGPGSGVPPNSLPGDGPGDGPGTTGPRLPPPPDTLQPGPGPLTPSPPGNETPGGPGVPPLDPPPDTPPLAVRPQTVPVVQDAALETTDPARGILGSGAVTGSGSFSVLAARAGTEPDGRDTPLAEGGVTLRGTYGTLVLHADGTYSYTADRAAALPEGRVGADVFSVTVGGPNGAILRTTFSVDVTGLNDAPTVAEPLTLAESPAGEAREVSADELCAGAADIDGDALTVAGLAVASGGGRIVDLGGGRYRYEPGEGARGPVTLTYRIIDGHGGACLQTATFDLVAIEAPPVLTLSGGAVSFREDAAPVALSEGLTVSDADSTTLSRATVRITENFRPGEDVLAVDLPEAEAIRAHYDAHTGILTLTGEASLADYARALLSLTYANGSDAPSQAPRTVAIVVADAGGLCSAPVLRDVAVVAVPDAPEARDDNAFVESGTSVSIDVLANDSDPEGGAVAVSAVGEPAHGTAVLNPDGTITYTPKAGYSGADSFTYTVRDADGQTAQATVDVIVGRAGHQTVGGDVFLQGAYMEIGVARHGSLGTESDAPDGFHPQAGGSRQLSFVIDADGWDTGDETTSNDVTIPGTPEDAIVIAHDGRSFANSERTAKLQFDATTTDTSSGGRLQATTVGTTGDGLKITQVIDLDPNATYFKTTVTLTNTTSEIMRDARFMRSFDPDQDAIRYGDYATDNDVLANPSEAGGVAVVQAYGTKSGVSVNLVAFDKAARASSDGFSNHDAYLPNVYDTPRDPNGAHIDTGISLNIQFSDLRPGQSATHTFYTTLNASQGANDLVVGSAAAETLDGRGGDDLILGLGGGDTLTGGTGSDTFVFDAATFGRTTITDFATGADLLQFDRSVFSSAEAVLGRATQSGADLLITYDQDHVLTLKNVILANLHATDIQIL